MNIQPPLSRSQDQGISNPIVGSAVPVLRPASSIAGPSLLSQIEIPFVHKWLILKCTLAGMLMGLLLIVIWPRTYESEGQLIIRVGRESVALDPTATLGSQTLLVQKTRAEEINSALAILSSRRIYEGVVSKIGAEHILNGSFFIADPVAEQTELRQLFDGVKSTVANRLDATLVTLGLRDRFSASEMAIKGLQESVKIFAPRESAVISIKASAKTPEMAQAIAQSVIDAFLEQHMQVSRTPGSYAFFEKQARKSESELNELIEERTEFLTLTDLISVSSNREILQEQVTATTKQLMDSEGQLKKLRAEIEHTTIGDIQRLTTGVASLIAMIEEKKSQRKAITNRINDLAHSERKLKQLDRDIALKEATLHSLRVRLEEARIIDEMGRDKISNVSVFQPPTLIERPTSPKKLPLAALFTVLGLALGLVASYVREANSKTLRSVEHVVASTGAESIYAIERNWLPKNLRRTMLRPAEDLDRTCKSILSDSLLLQNWGGQRSVGVIGCDTGCGASSVAARLSFVSCQECGMNTTLVDADGKNQTVSKTFRLSCSPGLAELTHGDADFDECLQQIETNLSLVPFSSTSSHQRLNGNFDAVVSTLNALRAKSDVLVVDLPPACDYPEAVALARQLDHVIVVIESEKTTGDQASKLLRHLDAGQCQVAGVIINKTKQHTPQWLV